MSWEPLELRGASGSVRVMTILLYLDRSFTNTVLQTESNLRESLVC